MNPGTVLHGDNSTDLGEETGADGLSSMTTMGAVIAESVIAHLLP